MKKRAKPSWKSLSLGEKIGVIMFYVLGIGIALGMIIIMYLQAPIVW